MDEYDYKLMESSDKKHWSLKCPGCNHWGDLDDDQFHGRVSVLCGCGFHRTVNFGLLVGEEPEPEEDG